MKLLLDTGVLGQICHPRKHADVRTWFGKAVHEHAVDVTARVSPRAMGMRLMGDGSPHRMALTPYGVHAMLWHVATVVQGDFEWDAAKAEANVAKHGVTFEEAATVITDPDAVFLVDAEHPDRFVAIGASAKGRTLYVVHVEQGQRDRIISARRATPAEETIYTQR